MLGFLSVESSPSCASSDRKRAMPDRNDVSADDTSSSVDRSPSMPTALSVARLAANSVW